METISMARRPEEKYWWDDIPEPVKIDIQPTAAEQKELDQDAPKVRQSCMMFTVSAFIRFYCFATGVLMIAYGAWVLYQIQNKIIPLPIVANVAMGGFLILAGFLTVLAETRTRRTMRACLNTYLFLSNHIARGIFYVIIGGLTFPIDVTIPYIGEFGNSKVLAGVIVAGGLMNLCFAPWRYKFLRRREMSKQKRGIANAEEIVYELNIVNGNKTTPVTTPEVAAVAPLEGAQENFTNGASVEKIEYTTTTLEKGDKNVELGQKDVKFTDIELGGASGAMPVM